MNGRITFIGNPWPNGHAIETCEFAVRQFGEDYCLILTIQTQRYSHEKKFDSDEQDLDATDWESPIVWNNFGRCSMECEPWNVKTIISSGEFDESIFDGLEMHVDPLKDLDEDWAFDERAFSTYLLGHDAVCDHRLKFTKTDTGYTIQWTGRIALAYVGRREFEYSFEALIKDVEFQGCLEPIA